MSEKKRKTTIPEEQSFMDRKNTEQEAQFFLDLEKTFNEVAEDEEFQQLMGDIRAFSEDNETFENKTKYFNYKLVASFFACVILLQVWKAAPDINQAVFEIATAAFLFSFVNLMSKIYNMVKNDRTEDKLSEKNSELSRELIERQIYSPFNKGKLEDIDIFHALIDLQDEKIKAETQKMERAQMNLLNSEQPISLNSDGEFVLSPALTHSASYRKNS